MIALAGCQHRSAQPLDAVARGRLLYTANCAVCHNANPNLPGTLGPAIAGSPKILIVYRVTKAAYPPGYKPKRTTRLMQPLPWLSHKNIDDLAAFLAASARSNGS